MNINYTPEQLAAFEDDIANCFNTGLIKAPVHLESGNEQQLINIFKDRVHEDDWLLCSWRSHLKCLLKGVPLEVLKAEILAGHSMGLCFPDYKIISSAIVGGTAPIAVGLAMGIKRSGGTNKVVCMLGDMTAETGIAWECFKYAKNHDLPILWVEEDNNKSTNTPTEAAWGDKDINHLYFVGGYFTYTSKYPHSGAGKWVMF